MNKIEGKPASTWTYVANDDAIKTHTGDDNGGFEKNDVFLVILAYAGMQFLVQRHQVSGISNVCL